VLRAFVLFLRDAVPFTIVTTVVTTVVHDFPATTEVFAKRAPGASRSNCGRKFAVLRGLLIDDARIEVEACDRRGRSPLVARRLLDSPQTLPRVSFCRRIARWQRRACKEIQR